MAAAFESGQLPEERLEGYRKLRAELEFHKRKPTPGWHVCKKNSGRKFTRPCVTTRKETELLAQKKLLYLPQIFFGVDPNCAVWSFCQVDGHSVFQKPELF